MDELGDWVADPHPITDPERHRLDVVRWSVFALFAFNAWWRGLDGVSTADMEALVLFAAWLVPYFLLSEWIAGGTRALD
jgi:hypothetical protein